MLKLTFLAADRPLAKSYSLDSEGNLVKESYPRVLEFTSRDVVVAGLSGFLTELKRASEAGECLLKGTVARPLANESRAGSTDPNAPTHYLCLDFDRLPAGFSISRAVSALGLGEYSYILQYSASHGIERDRGETGHAFFLLSKPIHPAALKQWLIAANLKTECLRPLIGLTKTNNALSWPLDISTCQNDKLIYVADPALGAGITPPTGERIRLVVRDVECIDPGSLSIPSAEENRGSMNSMLDGLRARSGLPARKWSMKIDKASGLEVLQKPDQSTLTGIKCERGFTYLNLNGGDSWGYFHPNDSPDIIRNFKGEPYYSTKELLPEYWAQLQAKARSTEPEAQAPLVLAFRDFWTSTYYNGIWDPNTEKLELARAASELQLQHFLVDNGRPKQDIVPVWKRLYNPHSETRVDTVRKTINLFEPTPYMSQKPEKPVLLEVSCPIIHRIIQHAVGHDAATRSHYLNWLACVFQKRVRTQTSWVLHGIEGTGKGLLIHKVLIPLLGRGNVAVVPMRELEDRFNPFVESSLLVVVDEAEINESKVSSMIMASMKNWITEPEVSVRKMFTAAYTVPNYCNFLFNSNKPAPVVVSSSDRRINVAEFQSEKLEISDAEIESIKDELPAFADYLLLHAADTQQARTVLVNSDRLEMMAASSNSIETTAQALRKGNLEFFWDALPAGESGHIGAEQTALYDAYTHIIRSALREPSQVLTRDELRVLFAYNVGDVPRTPAKFASFLNHHRIYLEAVTKSDRSVRGYKVNWVASQDWIDQRLKELK